MRRDAARRRVLVRSSWHGQNNAQEWPNLVYALDRAVFSLEEFIAHAQADQNWLHLADMFLSRNLVAKFDHLLEGH